MGPDQTVEIMRRMLIEAMMLSAPLLVTACAVSLAGESVADADQRAGADINGGAKVGRGVCCDRRRVALDGASSGEVYRCICCRLSQVPGIDTT